MNRKEFLKSSLVLPFSGVVLPTIASSNSSVKETIPVETIKEFVVAGHNNLDFIKDMLEETPNLLYCRYDWGSGDFEEAIEGAGHVGNHDIAEYLISKGARVNLFVLSMLGKTELVKPVLETYPELIFSKGPHGFNLLHHAIKGGEKSQKLVNYLNSKGLKKPKFDI